MFKSLAEAIITNTALAGEGFAWEGVKGTSRPAGGVDMQGYRAWLWYAQNGLCAACGDAVSIDEGEVAHVVSNHGSPSKGRGYLAANCYMAHTACNEDDWTAFGPIVPAASFVRGDLVPLTYPTRQEMRAAYATMAGARSAATAAEREARFRRRMDGMEGA